MEGITETDPPERSALASQLDYGQSDLETPAQPMLDITHDEITDTDPSERSALATHLEYGLLNLESLSCPMVDVALDRRNMEGITAPLLVESLGLDMVPSSGPMEHCVKRKSLWMMSVRRAYDSGIWIWILSINMTFNGLPVYYGGNMYDSEEDDPLERVRAAYVEDYNIDVPEGMELMAYNRRRPDGGEARSVMCHANWTG